MPDNSMAIFFSAPIRNRSNDTDFPYHQNTQFYYLTGITDPNSMLLIYKLPFLLGDKSSDEFLFIPYANKKHERWLGKMTSAGEATEISAIQNIYFTSAFDSLNLSAQSFDKIFYLPLQTGVADDKNDSCDLFNLIESWGKKVSYPPVNGDSYLLGKILRRMREIKKPVELTLLKKAISISCEGHIEMMKALHKGMTEYQVAAIGEYIFKIRGAENVGYPSICGGGENSCILHYETNRKTLKEGELLLIDMGAEYHGYSADVTRTLPVNGKFSNEQRIIYTLVLEAQDSAFAKCKPGSNFKDPHQAAVDVIK